MTSALSVLLLASAMATPLHAEKAAASHSADRAQIQQLVERFKAAIIAKNGDTLRTMFLPGGSWLQGLDQASLVAVRAQKPDAKQFAPGRYTQFAAFVSAAPKAIEETFDNVRIETDGTIGSVYFDYQFLEEGRSQNHGVETWQLVHTDDGWKISAMLYSVIVDDSH